MCVCVWDVFNEVSTRLDRQAHLSDRFPQNRRRLSCLEATVPEAIDRVECSVLSLCHSDATHPRVRQAVGGWRIRLVHKKQ